MTQISEAVERQVAKATRGPGDVFIERLAERLGGAAAASAVYGTAVEREGVTVIPVAKVRWGFGGGGGSNEGTAGGSGAGGGGGVSATPVGFIEITSAGTQYRPIKHPTMPLAVPLIVIAGGVAARIVLSGLRRIIRG